MRVMTLLLLLALGLWAKTVTVAVAANVSYAIGDLVRAYEARHPGERIRTIVGSSGKLTAQIRHGAPYDLFLSADTAYPEALYREGRAVEKPRIYARGLLALLSPKPRDLSAGLAILTDDAIRRVAVANPKTAPYGKAAVEALKMAGLYAAIRPKLIFGQSVSQTLVYTLKAADAGLVARSALFSPTLRKMKKGRNWIEVDPSLYTPIDQGAALLKPEAKGFYDFLFGPEARKILKTYGYQTP
ncbi:molybdate ABC transporter substrate-binding protein [Hydrogenimonas sp.]